MWQDSWMHAQKVLLIGDVKYRQIENFTNNQKNFRTNPQKSHLNSKIRIKHEFTSKIDFTKKKFFPRTSPKLLQFRITEYSHIINSTKLCLWSLPSFPVDNPAKKQRKKPPKNNNITTKCRKEGISRIKNAKK